MGGRSLNHRRFFFLWNGGCIPSYPMIPLENRLSCGASPLFFLRCVLSVFCSVRIGELLEENVSWSSLASSSDSLEDDYEDWLGRSWRL